MAARLERRAARARDRQPLRFLDPTATHSAHDDQGAGRPRRPLRRQRDSRTISSASGFRARARPPSPTRPVERSIRNVAYALLSGADGWMFDGEDALGQVSTMSLDNQRNLKLAIHRDPVFMTAAEQVAGEMNAWAPGFFEAADHRRLAEAARLHDQDLPSARPAPRRPARAPRRRRQLFGLDRRHDALHRQQPPAAAQGRLLAGAVPAEDSDGRRGGALERHPGGARSAPGPRRRAPSRSTCSSSSSSAAFS